MADPGLITIPYTANLVFDQWDGADLYIYPWTWAVRPQRWIDVINPSTPEIGTITTAAAKTANNSHGYDHAPLGIGGWTGTIGSTGAQRWSKSDLQPYVSQYQAMHSLYLSVQGSGDRTVQTFTGILYVYDGSTHEELYRWTQTTQHTIRWEATFTIYGGSPVTLPIPFSSYPLFTSANITGIVVSLTYTARRESYSSSNTFNQAAYDAATANHYPVLGGTAVTDFSNVTFSVTGVTLEGYVADYTPAVPLAACHSSNIQITATHTEVPKDGQHLAMKPISYDGKMFYWEASPPVVNTGQFLITPAVVDVEEWGIGWGGTDAIWPVWHGDLPWYPSPPYDPWIQAPYEAGSASLRYFFDPDTSIFLNDISFHTAPIPLSTLGAGFTVTSARVGLLMRSVATGNLVLGPNLEYGTTVFLQFSAAHESPGFAPQNNPLSYEPAADNFYYDYPNANVTITDLVTEGVGVRASTTNTASVLIPYWGGCALVVSGSYTMIGGSFNYYWNSIRAFNGTSDARLWTIPNLELPMPGGDNEHYQWIDGNSWQPFFVDWTHDATGIYVLVWYENQWQQYTGGGAPFAVWRIQWDGTISWIGQAMSSTDMRDYRASGTPVALQMTPASIVVGGGNLFVGGSDINGYPVILTLPITAGENATWAVCYNDYSGPGTVNWLNSSPGSTTWYGGVTSGATGDTLAASSTSWTVVRSTPDFQVRVIWAQNQEVLICENSGTIRDFYYSTDGGSTWAWLMRCDHSMNVHGGIENGSNILFMVEMLETNTMVIGALERAPRISDVILTLDVGDPNNLSWGGPWIATVGP